VVGPRRVSRHRGPVAGAPCGLGAWGHAPTTTLEGHGRASSAAVFLDVQI